MIHTYVAHESSATDVTYANSGVQVSWPAWPECFDTSGTETVKD